MLGADPVSNCYKLSPSKNIRPPSHKIFFMHNSHKHSESQLNAKDKPPATPNPALLPAKDWSLFASLHDERSQPRLVRHRISDFNGAVG